MSATNKTTVTRFENSDLLERLSKPSLHVLQYGSIYLGMRRIEPRLGTWALVLRQPNSPSSLIFYISATACAPVGGAADQPPRYMYSLKSKGAILSKLALVDEAGNVEKEIIDPAVLELAPHLSPIRSVCVTYFEVRQILEIHMALEKALKDAVRVNTEPEWVVSQRWVEQALLALQSAGFSTPIVERRDLNRALGKLTVGDDVLLNFL